jgi:hypothetical protein
VLKKVLFIFLFALIPSTSSFAQSSEYLLKVQSEHDLVCYNEAQVVYAWAQARDNGVTKEKFLEFIKENIKENKEQYTEQVLKATDKGVEIVFDKKAPANKAPYLFLEWCVVSG